MLCSVGASNTEVKGAKMNSRPTAIAASLVLVVVMAACTGSKHLNGPKQKLGNGQVWSWTEFDTDGNLNKIGVTMTKSALAGLPTSYDEIELPLPGTEMPTPPYHTVVIGWDPLGHAPTAYEVPHFDFEFYFITSQEVGMISPGSDTTPVRGRFRPRDYKPALAEPSVGTHWGDTLAPEFHGKPFTATFVYGFQDGKMIFLEPMVALSYLQASPSFGGEVSQPAAFQREGYYPTRYAVSSSSKDSTVTIALEGLTLRHELPLESLPSPAAETVPLESAW
jgi:hypothetical protein